MYFQAFFKLKYPVKTGLGLVFLLLTAVLIGFSAMGLAQESLPPLGSGGVQPLPDDLTQDLKKLDAYLYGGGVAPGLTSNSAELTPRRIYQEYLLKATQISADLLAVKARFDSLSADSEGNINKPLPQTMMSLQKLGALTQQVSTDNTRFRDNFTHGEEAFQSYQLIQKAIRNLEEAVSYWRISNQYRALYRGEATAKDEDDEVLRVKLETALSAIEELKAIDEMRAALKTLDADSYP